MSINSGINVDTTNVFGLTQFNPYPNHIVDGMTQFFDLSNPDLPKSFGYIVLFVFSVAFAFIAAGLVWIDKRMDRNYHLSNAESFNTAGRNIGAGLIAVDIVSHWTFPSVLLSAVTYTYFYGVGGPMWTSTSGVVVVWLFAIMAIELKHKAPTAHTFLEVIRVRWGTAAHIVFAFVGVMTNLLVSINMLQGMVVVTAALTGVNTYLICYIVPLGIFLYAAVGGLKATFTTSYIHTVIIFVVITILYFKAFFGGGLLGSIDLVYERLQEFAVYFPVSGNKHGSYLTVFSSSGLQLAFITTITGFSQLVTDQSYWQSAVAARPTSAYKGYLIGAMLYAAIMFSLPFAIGLSCLALDLPVSGNEVGNGLAFPATAYALIGKSGLYLTVVICFMSVTSCGAGEMVAVSSLITFDLYRQYINPQASGKKLVIISRCGVFVWAIVMGVAQTVVYKANIPVYLTGLVISVVLGSGVPPVVFALLWDRCTAFAACTGAIMGSLCGTMSWIVYTHIRIGAITAANLSANYALLTGAVVSLGLSTLLCVVLTFLFPKPKFDWKTFSKEITTTDDDASGFQVTGKQSVEAVAKARKMVWITGIGFTLFLLFIWPLLTLPANIWSLGYFKLMVYIFLILLLVGCVTTILLPLWEAKDIIMSGLLLKKNDHTSDHASLPVTEVVAKQQGGSNPYVVKEDDFEPAAKKNVDLPAV